MESVGCAWYSWLHSKTATNCYGNNRFSILNWQAWKQVIYTASRIFFAKSVVFMVSIDNLHNQPALKKKKILFEFSLIFTSAPSLMVFLELLPCIFLMGSFLRKCYGHTWVPNTWFADILVGSMVLVVHT